MDDENKDVFASKYLERKRKRNGWREIYEKVHVYKRNKA